MQGRGRGVELLAPLRGAVMVFALLLFLILSFGFCDFLVGAICVLHLIVIVVVISSLSSWCLCFLYSRCLAVFAWHCFPGWRHLQAC